MKPFKKQRLYVNKVAVDVFFRKDINIKNQTEIKIDNLIWSTKSEVQRIKSGSSKDKKGYHALVYLNNPISKDDFNEKLKRYNTLFSVSNSSFRCYCMFAKPVLSLCWLSVPGEMSQGLCQMNRFSSK